MTKIANQEYKVNKGQKARIHMLLAKIPGLEDKVEKEKYKRNLVQEYTNGREKSTTKLYWKEAQDMIAGLEAVLNVNAAVEIETIKAKAVKKHPSGGASDQKRKKILHYFHLMGWYLGVNENNISQAGLSGIQERAPVSQVLDMPRIDGWCVTYGKFKKSLNDHDLKELSVLITQVEEVYKHHLSTV